MIFTVFSVVPIFLLFFQFLKEETLIIVLWLSFFLKCIFNSINFSVNVLIATCNFLFCYFILFFLFLLLFNYSYMPFLPIPPPHPSQTHLPPLPPHPHFVHVSFIVVPVIPSSHCPLPTPPWLLLDCSYFMIWF